MTTTSAQASGSWTSAPALPRAATWYGQHDNAVPIAGGSAVLVAGGADSTAAAVSHAAVYEAAAGAWLPVGALNTPRRLHTLTLLPDGKVLATGGTSGPAPGAPALATTELYDPATRAWTTSGAMAGPRAGHSAVLLADGKVLVAGGTTFRSPQSVKALRTAELYDPAAGTWSAVGDMTEARTGHTALPLADGAVLVCGGTAPVGSADEPALAFCELYDSPSKKWAPTGSLRAPRSHHQATRLSDTTVLVTGGLAPGARGGGAFDPFSQRTAELYDLTAGTWKPAADMPSGRALHRALPFGPNGVLVIGGAADDEDEAGYRSAVLYDSVADTWSPAVGLADGRWAFAAAPLPGGKVLVTGGTTRTGTAAADPDLPELTASTEIFTGGGAS